MNREARKANLRKLKLPGTSSSTNDIAGKGKLHTTRKTRNSLKTTTATISNYFTTPRKENKKTNAKETIITSSSSPPKQQIKNADEQSTPQICDENATSNPSSPDSAVATSVSTAPICKQPLKRTKLTAFIYKNKKISSEIELEKRKSTSSDDFETPAKVIKKAPVLKKALGRVKTNSKRQPKINSAFLRNEQLFAEITAQHCLADNINPDDMQLALAISQSEAESCGQAEQILAKEEIVVDLFNSDSQQKADESIHNKLQKYGFRTTKSDDYSNFASVFHGYPAQRRKKCKWAQKFTALTLRNPELQVKKIEQKINAILNAQTTRNPYENVCKPYVVYSALLKKCALKSTVMKSLDCYETNLENESLEQFYVTELFDVAHVKSGYLLKDWTSVQGRDLSPHKRHASSGEIELKLQQAYSTLEKYFASLQEETVAGYKLQEKEEHTADKPKKSVTTEDTKYLEVNALNGKRLQEANPKTAEHKANESLHTKLDDLPVHKINLTVPESVTTINNTSSTQTALSSAGKVERTASNSPDIFADSDTDTTNHSCTSPDTESSIEFVAEYKERRKTNENVVNIATENLKKFNQLCDENEENKSANSFKETDICTSTAEELEEEAIVDLTQSDNSCSPLHTAHEFSFIDLIEEDKPSTNSPSKFSIGSLDCDPISSQILTTPTRGELTNESTTVLNNTRSNQRSEFGILEPLYMLSPQLPLNLHSFNNDSEDNTSILWSQSPESNNPIRLSNKRNNSEKFAQLLQAVESDTVKETVQSVNLVDSDEEFDEFDKLVMREPIKRAKPPSYLDQLLTAPINAVWDSERGNFKTPQKTSDSPKICGSKTPTKSLAEKQKRKTVSAGPALGFEELIYSGSIKTPIKGSNKELLHHISSPLLSERRPLAQLVDFGSLQEPEEVQINGKTYNVSAPTSPRPNFAELSEAKLQQKLYNFGIKPLGQKQAVKILEYIYNQTHPLICARADEEEQFNEKLCTEEENLQKSQTRLTSTSSFPPVVEPKFKFIDCDGTELCRFNAQLKAELKENEAYILQTNVSKKTQRPLLPLHVAWYNLVCSNTAMHEAILSYEYIDVDEIFQTFKSLGYRYEKNEIRKFFNSRGIIYNSKWSTK